MNWFDCLSVFEQVARHESFARTAKTLQLPTPVITKRIQWLEQKLGMTLFIRTTRLVTITEAGEYLLNRIKPLLDEWHDVQKQLLDYQSEPQGNLSIYFPPNICSLPLFMNAFHRFIQKYPKITLSFNTTATPVSLLNEKIDLLIAPEKYLLDPQETIGIKLFQFSYQCYGSPRYIAKYGMPEKPSDLIKHNCLIFKNDREWEFAHKLFKIKGNWQTDAGDCLIAACLQGIGIAYLPRFMVQKEIQTGKLKLMLENFASRQDSLKLFYLKHQYKPRKIALLIDFLNKHFDENGQ